MPGVGAGSGSRGSRGRVGGQVERSRAGHRTNSAGSSERLAFFREEPGAQAGHLGPPVGCPDLGGREGLRVSGPRSPVGSAPDPQRVRGRARSSQSGLQGARSQAVDLLRAPRPVPPEAPAGAPGREEQRVSELGGGGGGWAAAVGSREGSPPRKGAPKRGSGSLRAQM